jgi:predicted Rossmann fold nucleotide-binding protein DprA/Smf involved in DNA uptake
MEGARLVRGAQDVLELLSAGPRSGSISEHEALRRLDPRLAGILESVGAGSDTPGKLIGSADDAGEVLLALSELELLGLLTRGDGGRYVPRGSLS